MGSYGITAIYVGVGLLLAAVATPLARGMVGPNPVYGFRTRRTLRDEAAWYRANRASGRAMAVGGLVVAAAAVVIRLALGPAVDANAFANVAVTTVVLAVSVVAGFRAIGAGARDGEAGRRDG